VGALTGGAVFPFMASLSQSPACSTPAGGRRAIAARDEQRPDPAGNQRRGDALTGIIGARRAWTVSTIAALLIPWR
jgi:hypothetical protein